jgi:hypothetical protein
MYVGVSPSGERYKTYTEEDLKKMDQVQEFIILPSCDPKVYELGPYDDIVNSMMDLIVKIGRIPQRKMPEYGSQLLDLTRIILHLTSCI